MPEKRIPLAQKCMYCDGWGWKSTPAGPVLWCSILEKFLEGDMPGEQIHPECWVLRQPAPTRRECLHLIIKD